MMRPYRQHSEPTLCHDMDTTNMTARDLKVRVTAQRSMFGKLSGRYTASLGETGWMAEGTCKEGALQLLALDLEQAKQHEFTRRYIRIPGATFCLYWAAGWCYDIVHDNYTGGGAGSCHLQTQSLNDAFDAMARHAAGMQEQTQQAA